MIKKQPSAQDGQSGSKKGIFAKVLDFKNYVEQSKAEMRKVTWPTLKETRTTSLVVLGFVAVMVVFLGLVDLGLSEIIALILSA